MIATRERLVPCGSGLRQVTERLRVARCDVPVDLRGVSDKRPDPQRLKGRRERSAKRVPRRLKKRLARRGASKADLVVAWFYSRSRWTKPVSPKQFLLDRADERADRELLALGVPADALRTREDVERPDGVLLRRVTAEVWE